MSMQHGSWLSEHSASDNFEKSKEEFHKIFGPLTDGNYERERICNGGKCFYRVMRDGKELVITREDISISRGKYSNSFDKLRDENNKKGDSSPQLIKQYEKTINELKTMKKLENDLLGSE